MSTSEGQALLLWVFGSAFAIWIIYMICTRIVRSRRRRGGGRS